MTGKDWLTARPVAHRGLHDEAAGIIENTSSAFAGAMACDYAIELDMQLAGDGNVIVFHDETLDRLTHQTGPVIDMSVPELRRARFRNSNDRIQILEEVLEQVDEKVPLILEVKSQWTNVGPLEQRVVEILSHYQGAAAVMSFDTNSVATLRTLSPGLTLGLVAEKFGAVEYAALGWYRRFCSTHLLHAFSIKPDFINYNVKHLPALAPSIARKVGLPLLTWTVRTPHDGEVAARYADAMVFEGFRP